MSVSFHARALAIPLALLVAWVSPAQGQIDTEEERESAEARERAIEKGRQRGRNTLTDKTELDRLVESARLFPLVGKDPPPFTLPGPNGKRMALSDFAQQVVLLYFWRTTPPSVSDELTSTMDTLQRELLPRRFRVLAVATMETPESLAAWMKGRGLSPVFLLDTDGVVADLYKVKVVPTIYLIGRDHKLVGRVTRTRSWVEGPARELLDYLLKAPTR